MTWYAALGALEQGFVYGIMVVGVYLTFRILDFPDLTVDGSLPLGAAISAVSITSGINPYLSLLFAMMGGVCAGVVTALLNTKFKILHLLASILTMIALYSINIRVMGGPNIALLGSNTVFDPLIGLGVPAHYAGLIIFGAFAFGVTSFVIWFLKTELGQAILATGDNPQMITSLGVNTHFIIIIGVGLSNGLVALSGALIAQNQGGSRCRNGDWHHYCRSRLGNCGGNNFWFPVHGPGHHCCSARVDRLPHGYCSCAWLGIRGFYL